MTDAVYRGRYNGKKYHRKTKPLPIQDPLDSKVKSKQVRPIPKAGNMLAVKRAQRNGQFAFDYVDQLLTKRDGDGDGFEMNPLTGKDDKPVLPRIRARGAKQVVQTLEAMGSRRGAKTRTSLRTGRDPRRFGSPGYFDQVGEAVLVSKAVRNRLNAKWAGRTSSAPKTIRALKRAFPNAKITIDGVDLNKPETWSKLTLSQRRIIRQSAIGLLEASEKYPDSAKWLLELNFRKTLDSPDSAGECGLVRSGIRNYGFGIDLDISDSDPDFNYHERMLAVAVHEYAHLVHMSRVFEELGINVKERDEVRFIAKLTGRSEKEIRSVVARMMKDPDVTLDDGRLSEETKYKRAMRYTHDIYDNLIRAAITKNWYDGLTDSERALIEQSAPMISNYARENVFELMAEAITWDILQGNLRPFTDRGPKIGAAAEKIFSWLRKNDYFRHDSETGAIHFCSGYPKSIVRSAEFEKHLPGMHNQLNHAGLRRKIRGQLKSMRTDEFKPTTDVRLHEDDWGEIAVNYGRREAFPRSFKVTPREEAGIRDVFDAWVNGGSTVGSLRAMAESILSDEEMMWFYTQDIDNADLFGDPPVPPDFPYPPGALGAYREAQRKYNNLTNNLYTKRALAFLLTALRRAPKTTVWRGLRLSNDEIDALEVGGEWTESLATATGRRGLAEMFSAGRFGTEANLRKKPVLLKMTARNVPIALSGMASLWADPGLTLADERFISGEFRIVSIKKIKLPLSGDYALFRGKKFEHALQVEVEQIS